MSAREFISEISVEAKGRANAPAFVHNSSDQSGKTLRKESRLWDVKVVRLKGRHWRDLIHKNKPDCSSHGQLAASQESPNYSESIDGSVKSKEWYKSHCPEQTSLSPHLSPAPQHHHTLVEQDQATRSENFSECNPKAANHPPCDLEVNKEDCPPNGFCNEPIPGAKEREVTLSCWGNESGTAFQSQNAFQAFTSPLDKADRTQHTVVVREHGEPGNPNAPYSEKVVHIRVTKFVVSGAPKKQESLNPHNWASECSTQSARDSRPISCKLLEFEEETVFPPATVSQTNSTNSDLQHNQTNPAADMLTTSVVTSALAPNWSARSKKQRQGTPDANQNTRELQSQKQWQRVSSAAVPLICDRPSQPFPPDLSPQIGDLASEACDKENKSSMFSSRSSSDTLSGNLFNLRNHGPAKRRLSRAFSAISSARKTEPVLPPTPPVESVLRPVSPRSVELPWSRSVSQPPQFSSRSSSHTTGSLLLSLRNMNLSSKSTGTPSEPRPLSPTNSLNSPLKKVFRMSEPLSYVTLQRNRAKSLNSSQSSVNKQKGVSEFHPLSLPSDERQLEGLRSRVFLFPNNEIERAHSQNNNTSNDRGLSSTPPHLGKLNITKTTPLSPTPGSMLRRQHTFRENSKLPSESSHTSPIRRNLISMSDLLNSNNNNRAGMVNDSFRTATHPTTTWSEFPRSYDDLPSAKLNMPSRHTDSNVPQSPQNVAGFDSYIRYNNKRPQLAKTLSIPPLSSRSHTASTCLSPQMNTPIATQEDHSPHFYPNPSVSLSRHTEDKCSTSQPNFQNSSMSQSCGEMNIMVSPASSTDKNNTPLERASMSTLWQRNVEKQAPPRDPPQLPQSPAESPDPLSPSRSTRGICAPTTFSSLRRGSPSSPISPTPPSLQLLSHRRQTSVSAALHETNTGHRPNLSTDNSPSPKSKFSFDLNIPDRYTPVSTATASPTAGKPPHSVDHGMEQHGRPPMISSLYNSRHLPKSTTNNASAPITTRNCQKPASIDSSAHATKNNKSGSTSVSPLYSPILVVKFSEEDPSAMNKSPGHFTPKPGKSCLSETQPCTYLPAFSASTSVPNKDCAGVENVPSQIALGTSKQADQSKTSMAHIQKQHKEDTILKGETLDKSPPAHLEKTCQQLSESERLYKKETKQEGNHARGSGSRGRENVPHGQSTEKSKKTSGVRMDQMLDHLRQSFGIRQREQEAVGDRDYASLNQTLVSSKPGSPENTNIFEVESNSDGRLAPLTSVPKKLSDSKPKQIQTNLSKNNSFLKVPLELEGWQNTRAQQKHGRANQSATLPASWRTSSTNPSSLMELFAEDTENVTRNFSSKSQPRRKTTSWCESNEGGRLSNAFDPIGPQHSREQLSTYSDIKYGLNQSRSFSVSSVQSSRPSGSGRISRSSSRTSSISDLTHLGDYVTLDDDMTQETTINTADQNKGPKKSPPAGPGSGSSDHGRSASTVEKTLFSWDNDDDPTPPPSPTFSPSTRRVSRAASSSSQGGRSPKDSLSPRGLLPSRSYTCNLSVFEESNSDSSTTTDDEYYLDDDNGLETEL